MEATGLSLGKSVLDGALGYAKSGIAKEVALQLGIQRDHEFVTDELEMMRSFMMVAHEERDDNKVVKTWVKQVRETAYDVEDSLQDFSVRLKKPFQWQPLRTLLERRRVAKQMKKLRTKVEDVSQRGKRYRLINGSGSKAATASEQSSSISAAISSINDARRSAKRDNQRVDLVQLICMEDEDPKVIAVCGTSGDIGQTSIIRAAYENPDVQNKFPVRAWVRVMHPFSPKIFIQNLVNQFHAAKGVEDLLEMEKSANHQDLAQEFNGYVKEKRCLVVLNDLSTIEEWDQVAIFFQNNKKGSRIVVSTTQLELASSCAGQESKASELKQLSVDQTLYAFYNKVFGKTTDLAEQNPELVEEAKLILKKCSGLPLAIVTIGGFLANRPKTLVEWRKLNENISAELEMNPELGMIRAVLEKSYDGLPYNLKSCFLYLSIFPEDQIICRRRLVRRWTAEGYSTDMRGKSANDIADSYFMELKNRSMILPSQQSVLSRKLVDSCKVHDLIREIAISKSMEENLVFRLEQGCNLNNTHGRFRHLAISSNWEGDQSEFESTTDLSRIPFFISERMRFLRVLDLEGTKELADHHLERIGKLLHLKYLSLRGCLRINCLPDSLGNLRQLETLDIRGTSIISLPNAIIKLQKLQYIHAGTKPYSLAEGQSSLFVESYSWYSCQGEGLACCVPGLSRRDICTEYCSTCAPVTLNSYKHGGVMVPRGTQKLKDLHTLSTVNIGRGSSVLWDIKRLTGLRKLGVAGINEKNGPSFCSVVSTLSRLESLSVRSSWTWNKGLCGCLDGISSPPKNLQSLKLYGNLETLPEWISKLQHLVKLKLVYTRLSEHDAAMELLGNRLKLDILVLSHNAFQGEYLHFQSQQTIAFENLRVLKLSISGNTESVKFENGAMPKLEKLLLQCTRSEIDFSGLEFLRSINEVHLNVRCYLDYDRIRDEGIDEETEDRIAEEEALKAWLKEDELKKKIRDLLAGHQSQPILTLDYSSILWSEIEVD